MKTRDEVEAILRTEVERALMMQEAAKIEYTRILGELSRQRPSCEDVDRLQAVRRSEMAAREDLWKALARFGAFSRNGTIPEDLLDPADTCRDHCGLAGVGR